MENLMLKLMNSFSNKGMVYFNKFSEFIFEINYKERVFDYNKISYEDSLEYDYPDQAPKKFTKFDKKTHMQSFRYEGDEILQCKVLEWLSRPALKEGDETTQKWYLDGINKFLDTNFSKNDIYEIYCHLGNNVNRQLCIKFIESNYDLKILK
jgi:hypothetical protein